MCATIALRFSPLTTTSASAWAKKTSRYTSATASLSTSRKSGRTRITGINSPAAQISWDFGIFRDFEKTRLKNHKPGWLARLSLCVELARSILFRPPVQNVKLSSLLPLCFAPRVHRPAPHNFYITRARFSNSYCRTGRAHPAISTRPAASRAALGETP
jgi:hypothetical protein